MLLYAALRRSSRPVVFLCVARCVVLASTIVISGTSCGPIADCGSILTIRGILIDAISNGPVAGAAIGGRAFTDGVQTDFSSAIIFDGSPGGPLSGNDGSFSQQFSVGLQPCPPEPFPRPDRVEVIIVRNGCEQTVSVDINADTVVDPTAPNDVLELKNPILVPPCEP